MRDHSLVHLRLLPFLRVLADAFLAIVSYELALTSSDAALMAAIHFILCWFLYRLLVLSETWLHWAEQNFDLLTLPHVAHLLCLAMG